MTSVMLPEELVQTPAALVGFIGLDRVNSSTHQSIWDAFATNRSVDRAPIHFTHLAADSLEFPTMKQKRSSYDWYIPKGVLKRNWMDKHLNRLPAVLVIFMELDWNEPNWNERKIECASRVQSVRATLGGRGTKIAVVLVQRESVLPTSEDTNASERASSLCSSCELSARSLFVLPAVDNLSGYVVRLENAFYELAQNYYHQEIRTVKSHRDYLNKTTHLYLFVRHQFKAGFLNELKRDIHAAYKHYCQAYSLLMEVRATDTNIMEVKTVAGYISYKICRLAFKLNLPRDAISQFRKHMDIFHQKVGPDSLAFEHAAWQSKQCELFAEIFALAIKNGMQAIQTQHPGMYFQQAATFAIARRKCVEDISPEEAGQAYPDPDPLAASEVMEFYGQRPWRAGKVAIEPPDMEQENIGIKALIFKECNEVKHSENIVSLLKRAIHQFQVYRSPRMESHLTVQMAEEVKTSGNYQKALDLLKPVLKQYRRENWSTLLEATLALAIKCAFLTASVSDYVLCCLEKAALDSVSNTPEERQRVLGNLARLFDVQMPSVEPGLTSKSERAAVGEAAKMWNERLSGGPQRYEVNITEADRCCINMKVSFKNDVVRADKRLEVVALVKNDLSVPLSLMALKLVTRNEVYHSRLEWSSDQEEVVEKESVLEKSFSFLPHTDDVGKQIVVEKVVATFGKKFSVDIVRELDTSKPQIKEESFFPVDLKSDEVDGKVSFENVPSQSFVEIDQREPQIELKVSEDSQILIGEWFVIKAKAVNKESKKIDHVEFQATLLEAFDPLIVDTTRLTLNYSSPEPVTPMTPDGTRDYSFTLPPVTSHVGSIPAGASKDIEFFMRTSTTGRRGVQIQVSYVIEAESPDGETLECRCSVTKALDLETIEPFTVSSEVLSMRQSPLATVYTDETFLLSPEIKSLSSQPLKIVDSWLELKTPIESAQSLPSLLADIMLYKDAVARECFPLRINKNNLVSTIDVQDLLVGKYVVKWVREDHEGITNKDFLATTTFELPSVRVTMASLFISTNLPAFGIVRTPIQLTYTIHNRTQLVQEFVTAMDPSEAFMMSGTKQLHFKILPESSYDLSFVLYPLLAGDVPLPKLRLTSVRLAQLHDVGETLERLLSQYITVLPRTRPSTADGTKKEGGKYFQVGEPVFIENHPFAGKSKAVQG